MKEYLLEWLFFEKRLNIHYHRKIYRKGLESDNRKVWKKTEWMQEMAKLAHNWRRIVSPSKFNSFVKM